MSLLFCLIKAKNGAFRRKPPIYFDFLSDIVSDEGEAVDRNTGVSTCPDGCKSNVIVVPAPLKVCGLTVNRNGCGLFISVEVYSYGVVAVGKLKSESFLFCSVGLEVALAVRGYSER